MPVESVADIPLALVEAEAECSSMRDELELIAQKKPELVDVLTVLAGRADAMLAQLTACRAVCTGK